MAYATTNNRAPAAMGVAAIHIGLGLVIVTGLAGGVVETIIDDRIDTFEVPKDPPPAPPPEPKPIEQPAPSQTTPVFVPEPPFELGPINNPIDAITDPIELTPPYTGPSGTPGLSSGAGTDPLPTKLFDPIAPKPRNGDWVTDNDYRTVWINRGWDGVAGFSLSVGTNGRVENCTITQSTGHTALDQATCRLVQRRARFNPAKNDQGEKVSGTFSSAVRWQIPD